MNKSILASERLRPGWALALGSAAVFLASVSAAITNLALTPMLADPGGGSRTLVCVAIASDREVFWVSAASAVVGIAVSFRLRPASDAAPVAAPAEATGTLGWPQWRAGPAPVLQAQGGRSGSQPGRGARR